MLARKKAGAKQGKRPFQLRHVNEQTALRRPGENIAEQQEEGDGGAAIEEQRRLDRRPRQSDPELDEQEL